MNHTYNILVVLHDMEHVCGTYYGRRIQSICCRIPYGCKLLLHHPPVKGIMPHEYTSRVREKFPGRGLWARRHALQKAYKISFGVNAPCECTDNSSFVNGLKFLHDPNAPYASECTRATRGENTGCQCTT